MCSQVHDLGLDKEDSGALLNLQVMSVNGDVENAGVTGINMATRKYNDDDDDACNTSLYGGMAEVQALCLALGYRANVEVCSSHLPRNATLIPPCSHLVIPHSSHTHPTLIPHSSHTHPTLP